MGQSGEKQPHVRINDRSSKRLIKKAMLITEGARTMPTIFTKIINGQIPSAKIFEDSKCIAILDINPTNKGHVLVIPKEEHETILDCPEALLSHLMNVAKKISAKMTDALNCDGFNIMINNKPAAGQVIPHVHIHIIPRYKNDGSKIKMEHTKYSIREIQKYEQMLKL